jgi:hypothetical protein
MEFVTMIEMRLHAMDTANYWADIESKTKRENMFAVQRHEMMT